MKPGNSPGDHSALSTRLAALATQVQGLSPERQRQLVDKLVAQGVDPRLVPVTPTSKDGEPSPLSAAQERLWFLQRLDPLNTSYNLGGAYLGSESLDAPALRRAVASLVQQQPIFRTQFVSESGQPVARVVPASRLPHSVWVAAPSLPAEAEPLAEAMRWAEAMRDAPFDLEAGGLIRCGLLSLPDGRMVIALAMHHLVCDAWSLALLIERLGALYQQALTDQAPCEGAESTALSGRLQFADYARWERLWMPSLQQRDTAARGRALAGTALRLQWPPGSWTGPSCQSGGLPPGGSESVRRYTVDGPLSAGVAQLAREHNTTLYTVLLSVFQLLLHRVTGQGDLAVASSVASRLRPELEGVIGYFVNTLLIRSRHCPGQSLEQRLRQGAAEVVHALEHQAAPVDRLVRGLTPEPSGAGQDAPQQDSPIDALFVLQSAPRAAQAGLGGRWQPLSLRPRQSRMALSLRVVQSSEGALQLGLEFDTQRVAPWQAERWLGRYVALLRSVCEASPQQPVGRLAWLAPAERLSRASAPRSPVPEAPQHLLGAVAACVQQYPQRIAVQDEQCALTYAQFAGCVERHRQAFIAAGLGAGHRVLCPVPASAPAVVALWAVLGCGAAFVPCDPHWPLGRVEQIAQDSGASFALQMVGDKAGEPVAARLATGSLKVLTVALSEEGQSLHDPVCAVSKSGGVPEQGIVAQWRQRPIHPEQLAYLMYTSGSSGQPKGVAVSHANVLAYTRAVLPALQADAVGKTAPWRWGWLSSIASDLGYTSVWGALLAGDTLYCGGPLASEQPGQLPTALARHPLDVLKIAPSQLEALLLANEVSLSESTRADRSTGGNEGQPSPAAPSAPAAGLRLLPRVALILGGEAVSPGLLSWLQQRVAQGVPQRLYNHYGPTEATIGATLLPARPEVIAQCVEQREPLPIGRALAHASVRLADRLGGDSGEGDVGQLWIGGAGVAQGYWGRPSLSAERFVPDPESVMPGARCYLTGDAVRHVAGQLQFVARLDSQLQWRGHRIEPGEVEAAVLEHPAVQRAAAVLVPRPNGSRLAVCWQSAEGAEAPALSAEGMEEALRAHCLARLPTAMLPTEFPRVQHWPLLPSGKLDRQQLVHRLLPSTGSTAAPQVQSTATAPVGQRGAGVEVALCGLISNLLQRPEVLPTDNFFSLGGDSIASLRLVAAARREGWQLTPRQVFDHPTVRGMAAVARPVSAPGQGNHSLTSPGSAANRLSPIQQAFFSQPWGNRNHFNQAALRAVRPGFDIERARGALQRVWLHHAVLCSAYRPATGQGATEWTCHRVTEAEREALAGQLLSVAEPGDLSACQRLQTSLNLERGRVFAGCYIPPAGQQPGKLCVVAHHLVVDAVSWRILLEDFEAAYAGEPLQAPTATYAQWVDQLHDWRNASSQMVGGERWRPPPGTVALPRRVDAHASSQADAPYGFNRDTHSERLALSESATKALDALRSQTEVGWDAVLWAALGPVLCKWAQGPCIGADFECHGRLPEAQTPSRGLDLSRSVGWFTARYPFYFDNRAAASATPTPEVLPARLRRLHEQLAQLAASGLDWGLAHWDNPLAMGQRPALSYNFLGLLGGDHSPRTSQAITPFASQPVEDSKGSGRDPASPRAHLLSVNASVSNGQLLLDWLYAPQCTAPDTVRSLAQEVSDALQQMAGQQPPRVTDAPTRSTASARQALQQLADADLLAELEGDY